MKRVGAYVCKSLSQSVERDSQSVEREFTVQQARKTLEVPLQHNPGFWKGSIREFPRKVDMAKPMWQGGKFCLMDQSHVIESSQIAGQDVGGGY